MPPLGTPWKRRASTSSSKTSSSILPRRYMRVKGVPLAKRASATSWWGLLHSRSTKACDGVQTSVDLSAQAVGKDRVEAGAVTGGSVVEGEVGVAVAVAVGGA